MVDSGCKPISTDPLQVILGSDEREHWFLVKGGEDVRLDERVEQLFGIVNSLVAPDAAVGLRPWLACCCKKKW